MTLNPFRSFRIREAWEYRSEPESLKVLAPVFWYTVLATMLAALLIASWFGYSELQAASQAEVTPTTSTATPPPWNPAELQATLTSLNARQSQYQTLSASPLPSVADPSK